MHVHPQRIRELVYARTTRSVPASLRSGLKLPSTILLKHRSLGRWELSDCCWFPREPLSPISGPPWSHVDYRWTTSSVISPGTAVPSFPLLCNTDRALYSLLTPWSRVLTEKLIVGQLIKNFPVFYGTNSLLIPIFSQMNLILSCPHYCFKIFSIISFHLGPRIWNSLPLFNC
jgi:hypothetical protein